MLFSEFEQRLLDHGFVGKKWLVLNIADDLMVRVLKNIDKNEAIFQINGSVLYELDTININTIIDPELDVYFEFFKTLEDLSKLLKECGFDFLSLNGYFFNSLLDSGFEGITATMIDGTNTYSFIIDTDRNTSCLCHITDYNAFDPVRLGEINNKKFKLKNKIVYLPILSEVYRLLLT